MNDLVLIILGAILGVAGQWLIEWLRQRSQSGRGPNVAIAKVERDNSVYLEFHNLGPDSLNEMSVEVESLQQGHIERYELKRFFKSNQNPATDSASLVEYLGPADRVLIGSIPTESDDGLVTIRVTGLGHGNRKIYETSSQIAVRLAKSN